VKTVSDKVVRHSLAYLAMRKWLLGRSLLPGILGQTDGVLAKSLERVCIPCSAVKRRADNGHYAAQGRSRSSLSVSIKSCSILTYMLSCTILFLRYYGLLVKFSLPTKSCLFKALDRSKPVNAVLRNLASRNQISPGMYGVKCKSISWTV